MNRSLKNVRVNTKSELTPQSLSLGKVDKSYASGLKRLLPMVYLFSPRCASVGRKVPIC